MHPPGCAVYMYIQCILVLGTCILVSIIRIELYSIPARPVLYRYSQYHAVDGQYRDPVSKATLHCPTSGEMRK